MVGGCEVGGDGLRLCSKVTKGGQGGEIVACPPGTMSPSEFLFAFSLALFLRVALLADIDPFHTALGETLWGKRVPDMCG